MIATARALPAAAYESSPGYWSSVARRFGRDPVAVFATLIVLGLILMALAAPWIAPADPYFGSIVRRLRPIGTAGHLLGTDELGRDLLSRLIVGARLSLFMGITPVILAFAIGSAIGVFAGYVGGRVNTAIMRTIDVFYAFPSVLLAIALSGALGAGVGNALLSLTVVFIPPIARVAESVTTQVRGRDFVEAARASGAASFTSVRIHVLGNVLGPIFVYATSLISVSMILASGLSFLGLGVQPPDPEWGAMLSRGRDMLRSAPLGAVAPGLAITIVALSFSLAGDGLRDALDPKG
jgi:peptide/nickel transport system permease protein